jgi:hypothetical protein
VVGVGKAIKAPILFEFASGKYNCLIVKECE